MTSPGFETVEIGPGIHAHVLPAPRFKAVTVSVYLHRSLRADTVTETALLPSVLARGSRDLPTQADLTRALDTLYGAGVSATVVKSGETQSVAFHMDVIDERYLPGGEDVWRRALDVLAGLVSRPLAEDGAFRADYVDQEKTNLARQIEAIVNDKVRYAHFRCIQEMCRNEPFALPALGRAEDLPGIRPDDLFSAHQELLRTAPIDVFLVGGERPADLLPALREAFKWERGDLRAPAPTTTRPAPAEPRVVIEGQAVEQGKLALGYRTGVTLADDDYFALQAYNGTLGGFIHSKLFKNVREKASLAYYASSSADPMKGILVIQSGIEIDQYERALAIIEEQVDAMARGDISDEEMLYTKRGLIDRLRSSQDNPGAIIGTALAERLAGRRYTIDERLRGIEGVTKEDVVRMASRVKLDTVYFLTNADDPRVNSAPATPAAKGESR